MYDCVCGSVYGGSLIGDHVNELTINNSEYS